MGARGTDPTGNPRSIGTRPAPDLGQEARHARYHPTMRTVVGVGLAGALGALCRYGVGAFVSERYPGAFPLGTCLINVTGSFLLGLLFVLLTERVGLSPAWRTSVTVGFLGAYTTFSTFTLETFRWSRTGPSVWRR